MIRPLTIDLTGRTVKVYRNLRNGLISIQYGGIVVGHVAEVNLVNVIFQVGKGRARVLRDKVKNVHAYAVGTYTATRQAGLDAITYDPYQAAHFFRRSDLAPIYQAATARVTGGTVFI